MDSLKLIKEIAQSLQVKAPASNAHGKYVADVDIAIGIVEAVENLAKDRNVDRLLALDAWRLVYVIIEDDLQRGGKTADLKELLSILREIRTFISQIPQQKSSAPEPKQAKLRKQLEECMKKFKLKSFPEIRRRSNELERKWRFESKSTPSTVNKSVKTADMSTVSVASGSASGSGAIDANTTTSEGVNADISGPNSVSENAKGDHIRVIDVCGSSPPKEQPSNTEDSSITYQLDDPHGENRNFSMFNSGTTITGGEFNVAHTIHKHTYIFPFASEPIAPLPPLRNPSSLFTGRDTYLRALKDHFTSNPTDDRKMFLLHGLGGIGKTQICLKFIEQNQKSFSDVFWIDASSQSSIDLGLRQIAREYKVLPDNSSSALQWMSVSKGWLLVFDNADGDYRVVEKFLPPGKEGNILITSRNKALKRLLPANCFCEVTGMGWQDSIDLLLKSAMLSHNLERINIAKTLVSELGYIPLAIDQAGAYIHSCDCGLDGYLKLFIKYRAQLMSDPAFSGASDYQYSTYGTWEISVDMLKQRASQGSGTQMCAAESALAIQNISAFFHCNNISTEIVKKAAENFVKRKNEETNGLPQSISLLDSKALFMNDSGEYDEIYFQEGIRVLQSFALIVNHNELYSIHPLVHAWSRDRISKKDQQDYWMRSKAILACSVWLSYADDNHEYCSKVAPHIRACNEHATGFNLKYFDDEYVRWALVFSKNGWWNDEEKVLNIIVKERRARLSMEHPDTITAMGNLACAYRNLGKWKEAVELEVKVVEIRKEKLGIDHPGTLNAMSNLAVTYFNQGRWKAAEELFAQVMKATKEMFGTNDPYTLFTMTNLASTYLDQGRWQEAEQLLLPVVKVSKEKQGKAHPDTLIAMGNLASAYLKQGRWQEAEELNLQLMEVKKDKLGTDHPDTLTAMGNLASTYRIQGRWEDAEELELQVMKSMKDKFGIGHPSTLIAMCNLASTYREQGRWWDAEELEAIMVEASEGALGTTSHPSALTAKNNLASTYEVQGRWKVAEELFAQVMEASKENLGTDHPSTLTVMNNLASTYYKQGRFPEAEELFVKVIEARKEKVGTDHPETLTAMANLASTYRSEGRWKEAEELALPVMEASKKKYGTDHPSTLTAMHNLAAIYFDQGKWQEAQELLVQATESSEDKLGIDHPGALTNLGNLGSLYRNQGLWQKAEELEVYVLAESMAKLGINHPDTLIAVTAG